MKRLSALIMAAIVMLNIAACGAEPTDTSSAVKPKPDDGLDEPKQIHSEFYDPRYTADEVFHYFEEVVLSAEYSEGKNDRLVQKWVLPIQYSIDGDYTDEDKKIIIDFIDELNSIDGFPKMYLAENNREPCFEMFFMDSDRLSEEMGTAVNNELSDGIAQFWFYLNSDVIFRAKIGYDNDMSDSVRTAVLLEEIVNAIGISNDTDEREDSIVYSGYTEVTELSDMDKLILRILYSDSIKCGMDADSCYEAIKSIYY